MAGYNGYSMSNNAVDAYNDGEMPKSKWTKQRILEQIEYFITEEEIDTVLTLEEFAKLSKDALSILLTNSSWHHTSSKFNKTNFYKIDTYKLARITKNDIELILKRTHNEPLKTKTYFYADVEYGEWEGTKKHPKLNMIQAKAIIVGDWAYIVSDWKVTKKKVNGNYFNIVKKYSSRKPKDFDTKMCSAAKKIAKI